MVEIEKLAKLTKVISQLTQTTQLTQCEQVILNIVGNFGTEGWGFKFLHSHQKRAMGLGGFMKKIYVLEHFDFTPQQMNKLKNLGEVVYETRA